MAILKQAKLDLPDREEVDAKLEVLNKYKDYALSEVSLPASLWPRPALLTFKN